MAFTTIVDKPENLGATLVREVEAEARRALGKSGEFAVALPGGSVGTSYFPSLARAAVDWTRTDFFWADERAVPAENPESNFGLARRLWLDPARVPVTRIHRMGAEDPDLDAAAAAYADEMVALLGTPPRLDLALLGVGPDGHVCSLFAGHPVLAEQIRWVAAVHDSPKPPPRRLTLTLPALAAARLVIVVAMGESKAPVVREAVSDPTSRLPLALALRGAARALLLVDVAAAGLDAPSSAHLTLPSP
jgi:6-phosphogluconolactonase